MAGLGDDGYEPYGVGSDSHLRKALGDRGVFQGVQELPALGEGLPHALIRRYDCTCF